MSLATQIVQLSTNCMKQKQCDANRRSQQQFSKDDISKIAKTDYANFIINSKNNSCIINTKVLNASKRMVNKESLFNKAACESNFSCFKKSTQSNLINNSKITEQQIINSSIYTRLLQKIQDLVQVHSKQSQSNHQNLITGLNDQILREKKNIHQEKLKLWETKNSIVQLQEILKEQQRMLNDELEQLQYEQQQSGPDQQFDQLDQEEQFEQFSSNSAQESQQYILSKPTCSINQFISQKTCGDENYQINDIFPQTFTNKSQNQNQIAKNGLQSRENQSSNQEIFKISSEKLKQLNQFNDVHIQPAFTLKIQDSNQSILDNQECDISEFTLKKSLHSYQTNQQ